VSTFAVSLAPILVLILAGYGLKRLRFLPGEFWSGMERLTYFVLLPALLIHALGKQALVNAPWPPMVLVIFGTVLISASVLVLYFVIQKSVSGATFTSIFQGGVRFNSYIALAVSQGLYGAEGLRLTSVAIGFMVVLMNLLCVLALARWGATHVRGPKPFMREVIRNPLIVACAIGWVLSVSGVGLSGVVEEVLDFISKAALPIGLLVVGAALRPELVRGHFKAITVSSSVQYVLKPLLVAVLVPVAGLAGTPAAVLFIAFMTPTATSAYILARQMGGDAETMASIITFQTLLGFIAMPVIAAMVLA